MANVPEDICNLSQSRLGNSEIVGDIDDPDSNIEKIYAKWYQPTHEFLLKLLAPNFALSRRIVSKLSSDPEWGWAYQYEYPSDCLQLLGIGEVQDKSNNYAVESNSSGDMVILTDDDEDDGLQIRFIKYITDVSKFSPEYVNLFSWQLALETCMEITKDVKKLDYIEKRMPGRLSVSSALNSHENRPIRKNVSKFQLSKLLGAFSPQTEIKH